MIPDRHTIVDRLLQSYRKAGGINHLDQADLPSKQVIASICDKLLQLLFPGFFSDEAVSSHDLENVTDSLVSSIQLKLESEICSSLRTVGGTPRDVRRQARDLCLQFFGDLPQVRALLQTDMEAAYEGDPSARSHEEIVLAYPGLEAVAIQRTAHLLYRQEVPLIPRMMTEWAHGRTGIDIHPGARIGSHFFIDHGTGVVIGETCVIGHHVKLYHGVTLGARSFPKDDDGHLVKGTKRHPNVEDHVTIYPNGIILGGDTVIGARSTIGANVFLMKSVPPDTLLVRGEQVQRSHDKKRHSNGAPQTVTLHADELNFMI
jgi:serine O-acetyltransferase